MISREIGYLYATALGIIFAGVLIFGFTRSKHISRKQMNYFLAVGVFIWLGILVKSISRRDHFGTIFAGIQLLTTFGLLFYINIQHQEP